MIRYLLCFCLMASVYAAPHSKSLFHSLDPHSVRQNLALWELYPESEGGKLALQRACELLDVSQMTLHVLKNCINPFAQKKELSEQVVVQIEQLASHLPNRKLAGYSASCEKEILCLSSNQIDLGKALIFSQFEDGPEAQLQARRYSALLDLMALRILARLEPDTPAREKIKIINTFIFETLHYRFPPESLYAEKIDKYTFLASVMDNHLGVCLGVSALYLALAQRLDLPLKPITPPGHIYLSYVDKEGRVNIETTARGIDIDQERYLTIHTHRLHPRTLKEVVGMTHVNEGSSHLHHAEFEQAASCYEKALLYIENDLMASELLAFCYLLLERKNDADPLLQRVAQHPPFEDQTKGHKMTEDYLAGHVDVGALRAVLMQVDETKESIVEKQEALEAALERCPNFRDGLFQMAISHLMLNHTKDALDCLDKLIALDDQDPEIYYYLTVLHGQRKDFKSAWKHFKRVKELLSAYQYLPAKTLRDLQYQLTLLSPEPE